MSKAQVQQALSLKQESTLANARRVAKLKASPVEVQAYTRLHYRLTIPRFQRLASFHRVEQAIQTLVRHFESKGPIEGDRVLVSRLITMLEQGFEINQRS